MRPDRDDVHIRELSGMAEFTRAVAFQEETWGSGFSERVPRSMMKVTQRLGGVVAGAFRADGAADGAMVGFVFGVTGVEAGRVVHWSDILAVSPDVRDRGVGVRLKRFQRDAVLARGVTRMYWTFDPLESRNAYLNLGKLGAVAREYEPDMYGASDSPLHRGLGTDRFVAVWKLDSERVRRRLAGEPPPASDTVAHLALAFPLPDVPDTRAGPRAPSAAEVQALLDSPAARVAGGFRVP
ncbi:MAG: hypothetical protein RQ751_12495, partial [Longimicrobiales bacterium]|nr:hypothetical protein [Longimicrobiales bacterium]